MEATSRAAQAPVPVAAPAWAATLRRFNDRWLHDIGGGPRPLKFSWIINAQKAGTFLFLGALMAYYAERTPAATSPAAWTYLAMHGSYGLIWLMKDLAFPDQNWQVRVTIGSSIAGMAGLAMCWSFGWLLISGTAQPQYPLPDLAWFCLCVSLCMIGSALMIAADAQKYFTLRLRPGLIDDGMHRYVRHPNYLGEMMVYGSFAMMVWHWLPVAWLAYVWITLFAVNMTMKEASLSRHAPWTAYRRRSWWLLPGVL